MSNKSKITLITLFGLLILGGGLTYIFANYSLVKRDNLNPPQDIYTTPFLQGNFDSFFNDSFNDDFFKSDRSPFKQMEKMRQNMEKLFESQMGQTSSKFFDSWFDQKFGGSVFDIEQREDDGHFYYEIKIDNLDQNTLDVNVSNGFIEVSGEVKSEKEEESNNRILKGQIHQRFRRSFPIPPGVDEEKVELKAEKNKLIVKFPKEKEVAI